MTIKVTFIFLAMLAFLVVLCSRSPHEPDTKDAESPAVEHRTDTIPVVFRQFNQYEGGDRYYKLQLLREQKGDSLLSFRYFKGEELHYQYAFNIRVGKFELFQKEENPELALVDTLTIQMNDQALPLFKYERRNPPIDGDVGLVFNPKYGLMAHVIYTWGNQNLLTSWKGQDLEPEVKQLLLGSERLMRTSKSFPPPPPGQVKKIIIVDDDEEITDE